MFEDFLAVLLPSREPEQLGQFYQSILGLSPAAGGDGHILTAGKSGQIRVESAGTGLPQGPTALWVEAEEVDRTYRAVQDRGGAPLLVDLMDTYYGAREFQVLDPEGNITCIINYAADLPERRARQRNWLYSDEFRIVLYVKNLSACRRFYTETLGLPSVYQWEENRGDRGFKYAVSPQGSVYVETLFREPLTPQRQGTLALRAKELKSCFQTIRERCPRAVEIPLCGDVMGHPGFALSDPDGNRILIWDGHEK